MSTVNASQQPAAARSPFRAWYLLVGAALLVALGLFASGGLLAPGRSASAALRQPARKVPAPELTGGTAWLNTASPLKLSDLRGRIVLLDFWTLCCINCIHTLPDLARLEAKYPGVLVVIGVHTPKFDNERNTESIRKAILRYEIKHPVINDADRKIWDRYG